ncbi:MAG: hypothetical protein H6573_29985 [Lewinellaceae bacterium]|nr:hypothetical protein [Lewinellaceae bacterium]
MKPPFYLSPPAKSLYLLMGIFVLFVSFKLQKRRYNEKAEKIEETLLTQLAKEQQKLAEVEQQKEQELLRLKEEKCRANYNMSTIC